MPRETFYEIKVVFLRSLFYISNFLLLTSLKGSFSFRLFDKDFLIPKLACVCSHCAVDWGRSAHSAPSENSYSLCQLESLNFSDNNDSGSEFHEAKKVEGYCFTFLRELCPAPLLFSSRKLLIPQFLFPRGNKKHTKFAYLVMIIAVT